MPLAGPLEEAAEHRLHDVLGVHVPAQGARTLRFRQGVQPMGVAEVDFRGRVLTAGLKVAKQRAVGRGGSRRPLRGIHGSVAHGCSLAAREESGGRAKSARPTLAASHWGVKLTLRQKPGRRFRWREFSLAETRWK